MKYVPITDKLKNTTKTVNEYLISNMYPVLNLDLKWNLLRTFVSIGV